MLQRFRTFVGVSVFWIILIASLSSFGAIIIYTYDDLNRLVGARYSSSGGQPVVITGAAENVTRAPKLNGTVNPQGFAATYHFEWGTTTAYGNTTPSLSAGSGTSNYAVSANISGLTPNTIYHFRLVAASSLGIAYGEDRIFATRIAKRDFNGDGIADILWRNSNSGQVLAWLANGTTNPSQGVLDTVADLNWVIKGVGDFNGDGNADILWRHAVSGQVIIWLMNGTAIVSVGSIDSVTDLNWEIKGVGDFDGDGKADILWQHKISGQVFIWLMNGTAIASQGIPATVGELDWEIKGVGDFDGDGKDDILWRHKISGQVFIWLINSTTIAYQGSPGTVKDLNWRIEGVGDFSGNGKAGILWKHAITGEVFIWLMDGTTIVSQDSPGTVPDTNWEIKGVGDFNGDGKADILWFHKVSRELYVWMMNGLTRTSQASLGISGDSSLTIFDPYNEIFSGSSVPPNAFTDSATNVGGSSTTVNGFINPDGSGKNYYFEYGTSIAYGNTTSLQTIGTGISDVSVTANLTGLTPNTVYHYRLVAVDVNGNVISYGSDITFTTLPVPPTVSTGSVSNVTTNAATLNGAVNPNNGGTNYYFQWGTTAAYGNTTGIQSAGNGSSNVPVSANLSGLTFNTAYHYRLVAYNNSGTSYGADGVFATSGIPPGVTTGLAWDVTKNPATLKGTVNPYGLSTSYYFEWGPTTAYGNATGIQSAGNGMGDVAVSTNFSGVTPNTIYHFRLVAYNSAGTSYGSDQTFATRITKGDFNGDGKADILWRHAVSGQVISWLMDGTSIASQGSPGTIGDTNWVIKGTGDFNGDGKADILWQHAGSGQVIIWFMDGPSIIGQGSPGSVTLDWEIKGIGDFNGDGKADILWRHVGGMVYIWLMDGASIIGQGSPATISDANWVIKGVGDFNGDGKADILWQHAGSGQVIIWFMDGPSIIGQGSPATVSDLNWQINNIGDFNGDGKADILWRHIPSGTLYLWLMDGIAIPGQGSPGAVDPIWVVRGVGDFNGDGIADILWRNNATGEVYIWLMSGINPYYVSPPGVVGDFNWVIVSP